MLRGIWHQLVVDSIATAVMFTMACVSMVSFLCVAAAAAFCRVCQPGCFSHACKCAADYKQSSCPVSWSDLKNLKVARSPNAGGNSV